MGTTRIAGSPRDRRGTRGTRPGERTWEIEMQALARIHEGVVLLPAEVLADVARRLDVTPDTVARRFGEYARGQEHRATVRVSPVHVAAACQATDFAAATRYLRDHGVELPSPVIERLLHVAPGPDARLLRVREATRRLTLSAAALPKAA